MTSRGADLNLFFPGRGESAEPAREVCALCPVRQPCLDYAISNRIVYGVWGGLTERERRALRSRSVRFLIMISAGASAGMNFAAAGPASWRSVAAYGRRRCSSRSSPTG